MPGKIHSRECKLAIVKSRKQHKRAEADEKLRSKRKCMTYIDHGNHLSPDIYEKVAVTKPSDYVDKYQEFLATTDEKKVIAQAIGSLLLPGTVLDIGAGTGDIPDILGIELSHYTAIEQNRDFVKLLRDKGYKVIDKLFPYDAPETYNNVLMSYVLYHIEQCEAMIGTAWDLVSDEGQLTVVTYRDNKDDYNNLLHRIGYTRRVNTDVRFNWLREKFASLGRISLQMARSYIYSPNICGLAASISFVATNTCIGTPELRVDLYKRILYEQAYIDESYKNDDGSYRFPMDHYIFAIRKVTLS